MKVKTSLIFALIFSIATGCKLDTPSPIDSKPLAPENLVASVISPTELLLTWTDEATDEEGFEVFESINNEDGFGVLARTHANIDSLLLTGKSPATTYYYYVCSYKGMNYSLKSVTVSVTTPSTGNGPDAPSQLQAQVVSSSQINLAWHDNSTNEDGFKIEAKIGAGGVWTEVARTSQDVVTYQNTGLTSSTTYYFRVQAYNAIGNSAYSNEVSASTPASAPIAPSNLQATTISSTQIKLTWTDNSSNETGFRIERKTGAGGVWAEAGQVATGVTVYQNAGLITATTYYYRVCAFNDIGNSGYSNEANATTHNVSLITIIQPNGGEEFVNGEVVSIRWVADLSIQLLTIQLLRNGVPENIIGSGVTNDGTASWNVYENDGSDYKIRIKDYANANVYDDSDANFTIHY